MTDPTRTDSKLPSVVVEPATLDDLDAIQEIEQHSFPRPSPRESFVAELAREYSRIAVARLPGASGRDKVAGFVDYWIVTDELHILSIATHPDRRRGGIGNALLAHALDDARGRSCRIATLEVRKGNGPAIALYQRAGFEIAHVRQRYYQDNQEDALVMLCSLDADESGPVSKSSGVART